ncbi:hypothetical protein B0E52_04395, partial [Rhodanobacter sp. C06]|uniref:hypothetical protein n=1 Tax=Rhodanobacter sp. C06 TaxID=1945854 RepID=UPI0009CAE9D4
FDRYIREHAKLLDVGAAHRIGRSVIENVYDRGGARRFLNSLLQLGFQNGSKFTCWPDNSRANARMPGSWSHVADCRVTRRNLILAMRTPAA